MFGGDKSLLSECWTRKNTIGVAGRLILQPCVEGSSSTAVSQFYMVEIFLMWDSPVLVHSDYNVDHLVWAI